MNSIRLCLVLHNHQPIGNFDGVFEQAYEDSYRPFLDVFESYSDLKVALHTSGPLMEWLDSRRPEYLERLSKLVKAGRVEIVGGAYYEPILTMLPSRDRVGQIRSYSKWLEERLGAHVQGIWTPERVWEQSLTKDLAEAEVRYTVLDDFHFKNAGLTEEQLFGYFLTEDEGRLVIVFPGSEPLRYFIPFQEPHHTIDYLRGVAERHAGAIVVFGDDGEKFGTWPDTKRHVYDNGWLRRFFDALVENKSWLHTTTPAEVLETASPIGKVYLPDGSYREMTEWALPVQLQTQYEHVIHDFAHDPRWGKIKRFVRGGFWRNFKVKYPETNEMYSRMMCASQRLARLEAAQAEGEILHADAFRFAKQALYRGQCNCPYWHGAFGGIYLPHLRHAIYNQLIACDNLLDQAVGRSGPWVEAFIEDYNFDARQEIRLASDRFIAFLAPAQGGCIYELDVRSICLNVGATLQRRPEAYHAKVLVGPSNNHGSVASIHDRVVFKQPDLDKRLVYDALPPKSLLERFYSENVDVSEIIQGKAADLGDFATGVFDAKVRRASDRVQAQLTRTGLVQGSQVKVTKGITVVAGSDAIELVYLLENLPQDKAFRFGIEFHLAGLPSGAADRYFHQGSNRLGQLETQLHLQDTQEIALCDDWLGMDLRLACNRTSSFWTYPIETVSQSEGGFELVHQSVAVIPNWVVKGDQGGRWSVTLTLVCDTSVAERRAESHAAAEAVGS